MSNESKSGLGCFLIAVMFIVGVFAPLPLWAKVLLLIVAFDDM